MQSQSIPVYVQPQVHASRPLVHGTRLGSINCPGPLIIILVCASSIALIAGFFMAVFGYDYSYRYYYYTSGVRKAGIVFTVFGGIGLIFGVMLLFKSHNENKARRGFILPQGQAVGPVAPQLYQTPVQQSFNSGFGYNQDARPVPQQAPPVQQAQGSRENPPPYQPWENEGVKH